jgi:hypothetical protein
MTVEQLPFGANMALRRSALELRDPPFEPLLGHRAHVNVGWEETHVLEHVLKHYRIEYRADAVVHHVVSVNGLTVDALRRKCFQLGYGLARKERIERVPRPDLARRLVRAARTYSHARRARRASGLVPADSGQLWRELQSWMWAGKHVEMLVGFSPRLADWTAGRLVSTGCRRNAELRLRDPLSSMRQAG